MSQRTNSARSRIDLTQGPIFKNGELVYKCPTIDEIRNYCMEQVDSLWDEVKRFENPHEYYVDLSKDLWNIKQELLNKYGYDIKDKKICISGSGNVAIYAAEKAIAMGAKVIVMSDSDGWIYDEEGIDIKIIKEIIMLMFQGKTSQLQL